MWVLVETITTGDSDMSNSVNTNNTNSLIAFSEHFDVEIIAEGVVDYKRQVSGPVVKRITIVQIKNKQGEVLKTQEQRWWYDENGLLDIKSVDCSF
jgi:uncharacterized protein YcfL